VKLRDDATITCERIQKAFGNDSLLRAHIFWWQKDSVNGRETVEDEPRSVRSSTSIDFVRAFIRQDRCFTIRMTAVELNIVTCRPILGNARNTRTQQYGIARSAFYVVRAMPILRQWNAKHIPGVTIPKNLMWTRVRRSLPYPCECRRRLKGNPVAGVITGTPCSWGHINTDTRPSRLRESRIWDSKIWSRVPTRTQG
jgi:hypothetical protein